MRLLGNDKKISEMSDEEVDAFIEEKISEQVKKLVEKPERVSLEKWMDIMKFIKENKIVYKENLVGQFSLEPSRFFAVKKALLASDEVEYVFFGGRRIKARFVYVGKNEGMREAIRCFRETEWGREINMNCPEDRKTDVLFWLSTIFKDALTQNPSNSAKFMKGTLADRKRIIRRLYPQI